MSMMSQLPCFEHTGNGLSCIEVGPFRLCTFEDTFDIEEDEESWLRMGAWTLQQDPSILPQEIILVNSLQGWAAWGNIGCTSIPFCAALQLNLEGADSRLPTGRSAVVGYL